MFAKFSPDGKKIAYVSENNIYGEGIFNGEITQLTFDGNTQYVNGTFDWVIMMAYPMRGHSIYDKENTVLHLRRTMARYWNENL